MYDTADQQQEYNPGAQAYALADQMERPLLAHSCADDASWLPKVRQQAHNLAPSKRSSGGRLMFDAGRKTDAEYAIEYIQENPEAGLCCEDRHWWITPNANETDQQVLFLDASEAERLKDDARLQIVPDIAHPGRALWIMRKMT